MPYAPAMKKLLKFLVWLAGVAVFLLVTAHFTLQHLLNTPDFKKTMTGFIERATGRPADYGRIDYRLFPFSLVVADAVLKEKDGQQEFASIRSFSAAVDFRNKEVTSLKLEQPAIRIVQREDGTYNFSDLGGSRPAGKAQETPTGKPAPETPVPAGKPAPPPLAIRLVEIDQAHFEFVRIDAVGQASTFTLTNLDFQLKDFATDKPLRMEGRMTIGRKSGLQFTVSGPAPGEYVRNAGAWPVDLHADLDLADFADLQAFLPTNTLPFESLRATLQLQGALTDKLSVQLNLRTPAATATHPVALDLDLQAGLSLPPPVAQHLLAGAPLPESFQYNPPPCQPPAGTVSLATNPAVALLLRHLQVQAQVAFPQIAYGQNLLEQGQATAYLREGVLTVPLLKCNAYGGTLEARGNAQLLACPLSYQLERLTADQVAIEQALAANGLDAIANVSGTLHLQASASGHAVADPAFRSLAADATARMEHLQTVGSGGSLMDRVWLQLDNPILLQLLPRLQAKVAEAQAASATVTTTRYDEATATLALRNGIATLSDTRLAMPGYRLALAGALYPFDDRMDLAARLNASPEETARLTGGKDLAAYLPYENGGLLVPLAIRGPLQQPQVVPDLDFLLKNALNGSTNSETGSVLDGLSKSDRKHVEKGLEILNNLLQP